MKVTTEVMLPSNIHDQWFGRRFAFWDENVALVGHSFFQVNGMQVVGIHDIGCEMLILL